MLESHQIAFIGELDTDDYVEVEFWIEKFIIKQLKNHEHVTLIVGRQNDFDALVSIAIRRAKKQVPDCKCTHLLYLSHSDPIITYEPRIYESFFDMVEVFPPEYDSEVHIKRIVNRADYLICYAPENGIAYKAMEYAKETNKKVFNIAEITA